MSMILLYIFESYIQTFLIHQRRSVRFNHMVRAPFMKEILTNSEWERSYQYEIPVLSRILSDGTEVLKGATERPEGALVPEVALVKLREIKHKIDRRANAQDRHNNSVSLKDAVKILEGPFKGKQGPVEHIYRRVLFIYDHHHLEHAGYICAKAQSCVLVGGSCGGSDRNGTDGSRFGTSRPPTCEGDHLHYIV